MIKLERTHKERFTLQGENIVSEGIEGWENGLKPEDVTAMPGTYSIVNKVALAITKAAFLSEEEKN